MQKDNEDEGVLVTFKFESDKARKKFYLKIESPEPLTDEEAVACIQKFINDSVIMESEIPLKDGYH